MVLPNDFFPQADSDEWAFDERSSLQTPVFSFRARGDGDRRSVELDAPGHRFNGFFDRMTITPDGLSLDRIHFTNEIVDIPSWLLTLGPDEDRVEDVLPSRFSGQFGIVASPFTGVTTSKTVTDSCWTIGLLVSGVGGYVIESTLRLGAGVGVCSYSGQVYGSFSIYERRDEPRCAGCS